MKTLSLLLLLGGSAALGLWLGWRFLRREPNKPGHIAVHLLLGIAGLQCLAMLRRGAPDGTVLAFEAVGTAGGFLLVMALLSGLLSPMIGRQWGRKPGTLAVAAHATLGAGGCLLLLAWMARA